MRRFSKAGLALCRAEPDIANMSQTLIACHLCDLLQALPAKRSRGPVRCARCGSELYRSNPPGIESSLALMWAVSFLFVMANAFPIMTLESQGLGNSASLLDAVETLWDEKSRAVSVLVFLTTFLAPSLEILALTTILTCLHAGLRPPWLVALMRIAVFSRPWSMVEVFMLGVLVAVVKLSHLAHITPGIALWCYGAMILVFAAAMTHLDRHALWHRLDRTSSHET